MKTMAVIVAAATMFAASVLQPVAAQSSSAAGQAAASPAQSLTLKQQAIAPIAAATPIGDISKLNLALIDNASLAP